MSKRCAHTEGAQPPQNLKTVIVAVIAAMLEAWQ